MRLALTHHIFATGMVQEQCVDKIPDYTNRYPASLEQELVSRAKTNGSVQTWPIICWDNISRCAKQRGYERLLTVDDLSACALSTEHDQKPNHSSTAVRRHGEE